VGLSVEASRGERDQDGDEDDESASNHIAIQKGIKKRLKGKKLRKGEGKQGKEMEEGRKR
jgi:hypothetical protein